MAVSSLREWWGEGDSYTCCWPWIHEPSPKEHDHMHALFECCPCLHSVPKGALHLWCMQFCWDKCTQWAVSWKWDSLFNSFYKWGSICPLCNIEYIGLSYGYNTSCFLSCRGNKIYTLTMLMKHTRGKEKYKRCFGSYGGERNDFSCKDFWWL